MRIVMQCNTMVYGCFEDKGFGVGPANRTTSKGMDNH